MVWCRRNGTKAGGSSARNGEDGRRWRENDNDDEVEESQKDCDNDNVCADGPELNCKRVTMRKQV